MGLGFRVRMQTLWRGMSGELSKVPKGLGFRV